MRLFSAVPRNKTKNNFSQITPTIRNSMSFTFLENKIVAIETLIFRVVQVVHIVMFRYVTHKHKLLTTLQKISIYRIDPSWCPKQFKWFAWRIYHFNRTIFFFFFSFSPYTVSACHRNYPQSKYKIFSQLKWKTKKCYSQCKDFETIEVFTD